MFTRIATSIVLYHNKFQWHNSKVVYIADLKNCKHEILTARAKVVCKSIWLEFRKPRFESPIVFFFCQFFAILQLVHISYSKWINYFFYHPAMPEFQYMAQFRRISIESWLGQTLFSSSGFSTAKYINRKLYNNFLVIWVFHWITHSTCSSLTTVHGWEIKTPWVNTCIGHVLQQFYYSKLSKVCGIRVVELIKLLLLVHQPD